MAKWSEREEQVLKETFPERGAKGCYKILPHRTIFAIRAKAKKLKIRRLKGTLFKSDPIAIFGRWKSIEFDLEYSKLRHCSFYRCVCVCKKVRYVQRKNLIKSNPTLSCGCLQKEMVALTGKLNFIDITGVRFGRLVAQKYNSKVSQEKGRTYWDCICDCGGEDSECTIGLANLQSGGTQSCGCIASELLVHRNYRENNSNWKNGITPLRKQVDHSAKAKQLRRECFKRDNYTCQYSQEVGGLLHAHHIYPENKIWKEEGITNFKQAMQCERLWDVDNLITLAEKWHVGVKSENLLAFHRVYGASTSTQQDFRKWYLLI